MSKKEFIKKLGRTLSELPNDERAKTLDYYSELIDDRVESGASEEEAVAAMGDIGSIRESILADAKERGVKLGKRSGRKFRKVFLPILCVILGIGLFFTTIVVLKSCGVEFTFITGEWREVKKELTVGNDKTIEINMTMTDLTIGLSEDDAVHLTYYENKVINYVADESANGLKLTQKVKIWAALFINENGHGAVVLVPEGFEGTLRTKLTSGDTSVSGLENLTELRVKATSGDILVTNVSAGSGEAHATSGSIKLNSCTFDSDLSAKCTSGSLAIEGLTCSRLYAETTSGRIRLQDVTASSVESKLTSGGTSLIAVTADSLRIGSTSGSVSLDRVDAKNIDISATSGSVRGSLTGSSEDYHVESSVTSGSNNLPGNWGKGERNLKVKVTSGSISISFLDD